MILESHHAGILQVGTGLAFLIATCLVLGAVLVRGLMAAGHDGDPGDAFRGFEGWASAFMAGFLVITWLAYPLSAGLGVPVSTGSLMALGLGTAMPLWVLAWRHGWFRTAVGPGKTRDYWRWAGLVLVGFVYQRNFSINQAVSSFCLKDNVRLLLEPASEVGYLFRTIVGDQREGGPAFAAGVMGFFSEPLIGASVAFALCGMSVAAFTYTTVRRVFEREWVAVVAALVAAFHPFLFRIPGLDENLFTLAVTSFLIHLLLSGRRSLLPLAGFVGAYAFGVRHEGVLFLPAILWWTMRRYPRGSLTSLLIPYAIGIAPVIARHWVAMGSPLAYESFLQHREPFSHEFLGIPFSVKTLLNYPFFHEVVRTPFNPFPTFLMHPLYLVRTSGYLACGLSVVGLAALWKGERRVIGAFTLLWIAPLALLLSVLEHWDYPSKMSIPVVTLNAFFLWVAAGLDWAGGIRRHPMRLAALAGAIAFVVGVVAALHSIPTRLFPPDPRYLARYPCTRSERAEWIDRYRDWLLGVPIVPWSEWTELLWNVAAPPAKGARWEWGGVGLWYTPNAVSWSREGTRATRGSPVALLVDPTVDPAFPEQVLRVVPSASCDVTLGDDPVTIRATGLNVAWSNTPVWIEIRWRAPESILWTTVSTCEADRVETHCATCDPPIVRESEAHGMATARQDPRGEIRLADFERVAREGIVVCAPVPTFVVFIEMLNEWADRMLATDGMLEPGGFVPLGRTLPVPN